MVHVIGAGFGRTGTASLKAALERLGFGPCHHMFEVLADDGNLIVWEDVVSGRDLDWDEVFAGYRSVVDWPGVAYWRELIERYPQAPVVLTVRDPQRWYRSTHDTIYQVVKQDGPPPGADARAAAKVERMRPLLHKLIWEGTFGGWFEDADHAMQVFREHNAEVQHTVPDDRLLVFEPGQGWEPLCRHLGVAVPDEPFPHVNEGASTGTLIRDVLAQGRVPTFGGLG